MGFETLENTPIILDLAKQAKSTGWIITDGYAKHESCNAGYISVKTNAFKLVPGESYTVTYQLSDITSGFVRLYLGDAMGASQTVNGNKTETLVATGTNPKIRFYSDGDLTLKLLNIKANNESVLTRQKNTKAFSEETNKWGQFMPFTSDYGFSFFKDLFTFKGGKLYKHDQSLSTRNNIYGVQYQTLVQIPFNANTGEPKTFEAISYEGNQLLITTVDGIKTSLGQISDLIAQDFLKTVLSDNVNQVNVYDTEGVYSASFMRDKNVDIVNGDPLKGTMITVELITVETGILKLKNVVVNSTVSKIGTR